jgi:hypothetical protein
MGRRCRRPRAPRPARWRVQDERAILRVPWQGSRAGEEQEPISDIERRHNRKGSMTLPARPGTHWNGEKQGTARPECHIVQNVPRGRDPEVGILPRRGIPRRTCRGQRAVRRKPDRLDRDRPGTKVGHVSEQLEGITLALPRDVDVLPHIPERVHDPDAMRHWKPWVVQDRDANEAVGKRLVHGCLRQQDDNSRRNKHPRRRARSASATLACAGSPAPIAVGHWVPTRRAQIRQVHRRPPQIDIVASVGKTAETGTWSGSPAGEPDHHRLAVLTGRAAR